MAKAKKQALLIMLVVVLIFIIIYMIKYIDANRESKTTKFSKAIVATLELVKGMTLTEDYILIEFPDKKNIISKNGKITGLDGKKYNEFKDGYIKYYKNDLYELELSDGNYCARKQINETSIDIDMTGICTKLVTLAE